MKCVLCAGSTRSTGHRRTAHARLGLAPRSRSRCTAEVEREESRGSRVEKSRKNRQPTGSAKTQRVVRRCRVSSPLASRFRCAWLGSACSAKCQVGVLRSGIMPPGRSARASSTYAAPPLSGPTGTGASGLPLAALHSTCTPHSRHITASRSRCFGGLKSFWDSAWPRPPVPNLGPGGATQKSPRSSC